MAMMCVTSLATARKECQTGAKSSKAGKVHSAHGITSFSSDEREYRLSGASLRPGSAYT
jgi:hypothetical protein